MAIDYLLPTWDEYHTLTRKLAEKILTDNIHIDEIVAISRGGLTLGHLLTDLLRVPISTFTIQSYSDIQKSGEVKITKPLATPLDGKTVLLVDDVADRGMTMVRAIEYLNMFTPKKFTPSRSITNPTLYINRITLPKSRPHGSVFRMNQQRWS